MSHRIRTWSLRFVVWFLRLFGLRVVTADMIDYAWAEVVRLLQYTHRSGFLTNPQLDRRRYHAVEKIRTYCVSIGDKFERAEEVSW